VQILGGERGRLLGIVEVVLGLEGCELAVMVGLEVGGRVLLSGIDDVSLVGFGFGSRVEGSSGASGLCVRVSRITGLRSGSM